MNMTQNISSKIIRNTIFNGVGTFWQIVVTLILTPYIIGHIGIERFGIWALVSVLTGYFGLLDFGIGTSFLKYISEFNAKKNYTSLNKLINTGIIFYLIFAIFITILGFIFIDSLLFMLNLSQEMNSEARFVFLLGLIIFGLSNVLSPFGAIQGGLQRMDITNKISIAVSIPLIVGTIYFLESGYGLSGLMINNAIVFGISNILNIIIAFKILPELKLNPLLFSKEMFKKLFKFGYKMQVSKLGGLITFQIDKLLIGYFLNVGLVGFYQLGSSITQATRRFPLILVSALIPAASELDAINDHDKVYKMYKRTSKYLAIVSFPLTTFIIITAPLIMLTWMGSGYERSVLVIQLLAIGYFANLMGGVASSVGAGIGKPEYDMQSTLILSFLNLVLSTILIIKIGFVGAVIGTTVSLSLAALYLLVIFHKCHFKKSFSKFAKEIYTLPLTCTIIASLFIFVLDYNLNLSTLHTSRLVNFMILGIEGIIFITIYMIAILRTGYIDNFDVNLISGKIPFAKHIFKLNLIKQSGVD